MHDLGLWLDGMDRLRRCQGALLDLAWLGHEETPSRVIHARPGARLRHYRGRQPGGASLLIVPAPIKRHYIWDLCPERSVVRRAMARGLEVFLLEWTEEGRASAGLGLEQCAGAVLDDALDAMHEWHASDTVFLAGHSLGGTFAAIYGAWRPERIAGLVLIEAPLHFAEASGAFRGVLALGGPDSRVVAPSGRVPGSLLDLVCVGADPVTFLLERDLDAMASAGSIPELLTHWRVERWALDEFALPWPLFRDVVERLYREDRFMRGLMTIDGLRLQPSRITAPILAIYQPTSRIVPPESVLPFLDAAGSRRKRLLAYHGDVGAALQHVGALVGRRAHRDLWPEVFDWLERIVA